MEHSSDYFPVLGIQEFSENRSQGCNMLFHELEGARSIDEPHKHDFFIVILFERGEGVHIVDFEEHAIGNRQIHMVFPEQVHQWEMKSETMGYQLMISREWFEIFLSSLRFSASYYQKHPVFGVSEKVYRELLQEFRAIQQALNEKEVFWELIQIRTQLIGLMLSKTVEMTFGDVENYHANPIISKFRTLVDVHFKEERSVSFYAEKLNVTANYLNVLCRKNLKIAASSLIQDRILLESKRLLKGSEMTVKDIVYELGFYDHASFSKFFKAQTGISPTQFREQR